MTPRIYKPRDKQLFLCGSYCFLLFAMFPLVLIQHLDNSKSLGGLIFGFAAGIYFLYRIIIVSIGYKVTLLPDAVEVTTIHGTKKMLRSDITSYTHYSGRSESGINLISRVSAQSGSGISLLHDPNETILCIPLSFDRDQEFDDWITSLPCELGGFPLPKR